MSYYSTISSRRYCLTRGQFRRTIYTIGGLSDTGERSVAFWPVVDTAIGRLGIMMAMEGNYPENGRGLAMNGAEVVYRASLPGPMTQADFFEISNCARALENNIYVIAPNIGPYFLTQDSRTAIDAGGAIYYSRLSRRYHRKAAFDQRFRVCEWSDQH